MKIGILGSGRGTNFEALFEAIQKGELQAQIVLVISDVEKAPILEKARIHKIPYLYLPPGKFKTYLEPSIEADYIHALQNHGVEWVVLAGYMRVLKGDFFRAYKGKILNIHPSLLPAFRGLDAWRQALEAGAKITGCTVHFVDEGLDTGPIVLQEAVKVLDEDTPETLHARLQKAEHRLYPEALKLIAEGRILVKGRRVVIKNSP
ncbi:MAG: phosphoribosylglycinamide formyltransferase [Chlamydiae bacterium]|nr:phosphoribosylglycinamide formyltransferase [Chlamydiota bacterium]MBI3266195.1 phosphoribosylglycinamide formyltransferase [Chlamydiota bacterium]